MIELNSCKTATQNCIEQHYFAAAHLYKEEKTMKMHVHDCCEIYYSIRGGRQFLIADRLYPVEPGDIFMINQYESHYLTQVDSQIHERLVISLHPDLLKVLSSDETDLSCCFTQRPTGYSHRLSLDREDQQRFLFYYNKIISCNGYGHDLEERSALTHILLMLNRESFHMQGVSDTVPDPAVHDSQVDRILIFINDHISEALSVERLAGEFFLSESYVCRIFKSSTGMTINKYITARRISIAKSLLADGMSASDAAEQCGYRDYSNFLKAFTRIVGISPKKYAICSRT